MKPTDEQWQQIVTMAASLESAMEAAENEDELWEDDPEGFCIEMHEPVCVAAGALARAIRQVGAVQ